MTKFSRIIFILILFIFGNSISYAQVSAVTFGKNRIQYQKKKWQYYQTENFNVYFYAHGQALAKFVLQVAEQELPSIEKEAESSLKRRTNIVVYNNYTDYEGTNIGSENEMASAGGMTKLVSNKMLVYFDGDHANLKRQVRQGIADVLTRNFLYGDEIGEVAKNQTLLDLPTWYTDGYESYLAEHWSTTLDNELKAVILAGQYSKFSKFSNHNPLLAGRAFWYFIEEKYKKENVTFFFYLSKMYKSMNKASLQIANKKFKALTAEFMQFEEDKYNLDLAGRKSYSKGNLIESFDINSRLNYYRFNVNPNKKNNSYVVAQYKKGIVRVIYNDDDGKRTLLKLGIRSLENKLNPNYPMMAWDPKGVKIAIVYSTKGKIKLFEYSVSQKYTGVEFDLSKKFDQVLDVKYMYDGRTLLLSAVKNGHSDIFTYDLEKENVVQVTNDIYDDLDPNYVTFPNKIGIIYTSNRPSAASKSTDTVLPSKHNYNVFLVTNFGDKAAFNQITQLTNLKYGNARYPAQYNVNHFTFISDENGIGNRYAGFFTTKNLGVDTLVLVGDDILRNPTIEEIDSTLKAQKKSDIDSLRIVSISADSTYSFPLSNYKSSLVETRSAGEERLLSEVTLDDNEKTLYKIKVNESILRKRNVTSKPTSFAKKLMLESNQTIATPAVSIKTNDSLNNKGNQFQTEFETIISPEKEVLIESKNTILSNAKLYKYKPIRFNIDEGSLGVNSTILFNRYQVYENGMGPINLNSNSPLNGMISMSTSDILNDIHFSGAFKLGGDFKNNEWLVNYQNLKYKIDFGASVYRNATSFHKTLMDSLYEYRNIPARLFTNIYQFNVSFPFDKARSLRVVSGIRSDNLVTTNSITQFSSLNSLIRNDENQNTFYSTSHIEYVYDNALTKAINIWEGLRYKGYLDWNKQLNNKKVIGTNTFNFGFEARYSYSIYKNFVWACRGAADFSWGGQKLVYYLGGIDGWLQFGDNIKSGTNKERYFISHNLPAQDQTYAFQSLAVNMRGFIQNAANGNNALVFNSELRLPVLSTFFDLTVNNVFVRDFQLTQFIDIGSAWNGSYNGLKRPKLIYNTDINGNPTGTTVTQTLGGVGPFVGGYGFGARSTLFGYFLKYDVGWPMSSFFKNKPIMYLSLGLDF